MADAAKEQVTEKAAVGSVNLADLASKAEDQGQIMEVRHPGTGEVLRFDDGRPYTITLVGKDSDRFIELQRKIQDRRAQAMMRSRQPLLAIMSEKDEIDLLVNSTLSWDVMFGDNGSSKATAENYRRAYSSTRWLRRQVDEFIGNAANFFKAT